MQDPAQTRPTAQIIQFRPRASSKKLNLRTDTSPPTPLVIGFGKSWYHDEAIKADVGEDAKPHD